MLTLILEQSQVFFSYGTLHYFLLTDLSHDISTWGEVQICPAGVSLVSRVCGSGGLSCCPRLLTGPARV